ncbi:MAG TPA: hypothetical protein VFY24_11380 [Azospira sp.]|nr:hypothetical protein [Azospira sp.]
MSRKLKTLMAAAVAAIAAITATAAGGALAAEPKEHHHHHHFAADVDAFHGVLAPVWHAARGVQRNQDACGQAGRMASLAKEIRSTDASALQARIVTLQAACGEAKGDVEGALFEVHEAFHRLIEAK